MFAVFRVKRSNFGDELVTPPVGLSSHHPHIANAQARSTHSTPMRVDISRLTEEELIDLNHRVVQRLRMLREAQAQGAMQKFKLGDRVMFPGHGGETVY